MKKFLLFRTDRLGDFLISAVLLNSIKRNNPNSYIEVVASKNNYSYIKSFQNIDNVRLLKNNIFDKIRFFFIYFLSKFDAVIIHDAKRRSMFVSFPIICKHKITFNKNVYPNHINFIESTLDRLKYNFRNEDLNILKSRNSIYSKKKYCVLHFDEKWFKEQYIQEYSSIEPSENELKSFLSNLSKKINCDLIITTGIKKPFLLDKISSSLNENIKIKSKINFFELEKIIYSDALLISCHGFVSHVASSSNIKQIDIIDKKSENDYKKVTKHFRNYTSIYRKKFSVLSSDILNCL